LWALQHRGQESSGIVASDGHQIRDHIGTGLVAQVYNEEALNYLIGHIAIGHNRYSTSGASDASHNQPVLRLDRRLALAHNGNLPSTKQLQVFLREKGIDWQRSNDSEMMADAVKYYRLQGYSLEDAVRLAFPLFTGAFACVLMDQTKLVAIRDPYGLRPLSIGVLSGGFAVASETCALDTMGAAYLRDVMPGEMVVIDQRGLTCRQLAPGQQKLDVFEFVYFARPDSMLLGKSVNEVRRGLGRQLAKEHKIEADIVVPVPDSAIPAALGFAAASGIPFDHGLIKNRYIHRTFIRPEQHQREGDLRVKLNPLAEVLGGKRVAVLDDSIVRGTTTKQLVRMIKRAGAREVHVLVSSPPVKYPDFYGIDTPRQRELIAAHKTIPEIQEYIGATTLSYLSYQGMIQATGLPEELLSTSCFTGIYPLDIAERAAEVLQPV
jgi:amidophosphoribosyltransferase